MRLDAKNNESIRDFENWVRDELYGPRKEAKETQPMSDTLQEREDQIVRCECGRLGHSEQVRGLPKGAKVKAVTDIAQLGENVRTGTKGTVTGHCSDGRAIVFFEGHQYGHTFHTPNGYIDLLIDQTVATDYCDECKGPAHAPWCSLQRRCQHGLPVNDVCNECIEQAEFEASISEHQPAARGGGDKWYVASRSKGEGTIRKKVTGLHDWVGQVKLEYLDQIVTEHNAHQSLVAERERLRAAIEVAIHNLNAGNDPKFLTDYLRLTLDQNRSTPQ